MIMIFLIDCSVGKKQVFYNEMFQPPVIKISKSGLQITTENSKKNSALLIYKIEATENFETSEIYLRGFQALGKEYKNKFQINLDNSVVENIGNYKIFWLDPDNIKHELKMKNAP